jgi:hypothetical protein
MTGLLSIALTIAGNVMVDYQKALVCGLLIFIGTATMMAPLVHYVIVGWQAKRKDVMDGLNSNACLLYFKMFSPTEVPESPEKAVPAFEQLYRRWYGRRFFLVPGLLLLLTAVAAVAIVTLTALRMSNYLKNPLFDLPETGMAAVAGAYMWIVNDLTSRARRLDFTPSDVQWALLRLVIAVPMGYAFAAIAAKPIGPFIAFAVGAFPLAKLTSMLQQLTNRALSLQATTDEASDDIIKLQGINKAIVERLLNEDIATVTQIAYCDPVRLVMRSNLTFNFVTDCMNQALAWMYLEGDLDKIRPLGLRGASEIKHLIGDYDDVSDSPTHKSDHDRALAALPKIAAAIGQTPETLQIVFREIAEDPFTIYLDAVWDLIES